MCYTRHMNDERNSGEPYPWIASIRARGLQGALQTFLDVAEPLAPLMTQLLWVLQPTARLFGGAALVDDLARALESPEELATIRQLLDDD